MQETKGAYTKKKKKVWKGAKRKHGDVRRVEVRSAGRKDGKAEEVTRN